MLVAGILGSVIILCFIVAAPWATIEGLSRRLTTHTKARPTAWGAFATGALIGVFVGFIPAGIAYAVTLQA